MNSIHICNKITCACLCQYCPGCYNGCPQCGRGEKINRTTTSTQEINLEHKTLGNI